MDSPIDVRQVPFAVSVFPTPRARECDLSWETSAFGAALSFVTKRCIK